MLVSVIVPVYNVESYVAKCIESIVNQTFKDLEIILIDDGSTDSSGSICDSFAEKDKRIKVIHKENGGLSSARNAGLDIAVGDYIVFVDSDDYINLKMIETLYSVCIENVADLAICNYIHVDENGEEIGISELRITQPQIVSSDWMLERISRGWTFGAIAWNKMYSGKFFKELRYPAGRISEDEFISHRVMAESKKAVIIPNVLYYYTLRQGSITKVGFSLKKLDSVYAFIDRIDFLGTLGKTDYAGNALVLAIKDLTRRWSHRKECTENQTVFDNLRKELLKRCNSDLITVRTFSSKTVVWLFQNALPVLIVLLKLR